MGCTASKLDNEDTVRRCKERRRLMKEAVYARHHLAAAHADYCRSLRITGSALVTFASGESLSVSDHTPAVLLRTPNSAATAAKPRTFIPPPHRHTPSPSPSPSIHPPPPPPPMSTTSSHHHQKTPPPPPPRRRKPVKLPHILSDSSFSSSPPTHHNFTYAARANSTYSSTPSQASSVWNWDNFYPPPSPPDSEYFHQLHSSKKNETRIDNDNSDDDHSYTDNDNDDKASSFISNSNVHGRGDHYQNPFSGSEAKKFDDRASNYSSYSRYSHNSHAKNYLRPGPEPVQKKGQYLKNFESEEDETEREEVQCSEWGDHDNYSSTSSSSDEDEEGDLKSRSDFGTRSNFESVKNESAAAAAAAAANVGNVKVNVNSKFSKSEKLSSDGDGKSSYSWGDGNNEGVNSDRRIVLRHKDLVEIVEALREYFDRAASAGEQVSEMLEAGRAQLDRSFKQLRSKFELSGYWIKNLKIVLFLRLKSF